jgi:hypothetical protein
VSAVILPFKGEWQGGACFERSSYTQKADARAIRDARLIIDAKREADNWLSAAFLALLCVLDKQQLAQLEAFLCIRGVAGGNREAEQALAIVRLQTGSSEQRQRVGQMVKRLLGEAAQ